MEDIRSVRNLILNGVGGDGEEIPDSRDLFESDSTVFVRQGIG